MDKLKIVRKKTKDFPSASVEQEDELMMSPQESDSCDVCRDPTTEEGNEIIYCDSCNVCVHQACYGVDTIPEGKWFCKPCEQNVSNPTCDLCPNVGGAMKITSVDSWAHVSCAMWIYEVEFLDKANVDNIDLSNIPKSRMTLRCSICREVKGACIQCAAKRCCVAFHVTCGFDSPGVKMLQEDLPDSSLYIFKSFCTKHSAQSETQRQSRVKKRKNTKNSKESSSGNDFNIASVETHQSSEPDAFEVDTITSTKIRNHAGFPNEPFSRPIEIINLVSTETINEMPIETLKDVQIEDSSSLPDIHSLLNENMEPSSPKVKVMKARKTFSGPKKNYNINSEDDTLIEKNLQRIFQTEVSEDLVDKKEQSSTQSVLDYILVSGKIVATEKEQSSSSEEKQEILAQSKTHSPTVSSKVQKHSNKNKVASSEVATSSEQIASPIQLSLEPSETQPASFEGKHKAPSERNRILSNTLSEDQSNGERIEDVIAFLANEQPLLDVATQIPNIFTKKEVVKQSVKGNRTQVEHNGIQSTSFASHGQTKEKKKKLLPVTVNGKKRHSSDLTKKQSSIPEAKRIKTEKNITVREKSKKSANKSSTPSVRRVSSSSVSSSNIPEVERDSLNIFLRYVESLLRPVPHKKSLKVQKEIIATIERELDSSLESDSSK